MAHGLDATQVEVWDTTAWDAAEARLEGIELYHRYVGCDRDCPCGLGQTDWRAAEAATSYLAAGV